MLQHLAALADPSTNDPDAAAAFLAALATPPFASALEAVAEAVHPDARPSDAALAAAAELAGAVGACSPPTATALAASGVLDSLLGSLEGLHASTYARTTILSAVRRLVACAPARQALGEADGPRVLAAAVRGAAGALPAGPGAYAEDEATRPELELGAEGAWAVELLAGASRRAAACLGDAGAPEACLRLLSAALRCRPAAPELPRGEAASAAAANALHALTALAADSRRNCLRLRDAPGGAAALAEAFADEKLQWEAREAAAGLLEDVAAAQVLEESQPAPLPGSGAAHASSQLAEWRSRVLPPLVAVLRARRGAWLQESKAAAAGVLARFAAVGEAAGAIVAAAGALPPLVQLLAVATRLAGGERATALVVLRALHALAPAAKDALLAARAAGSGGAAAGAGQGLLDLLIVIMEDARVASASAERGAVFGVGAGLAAGYACSAVVRAGWAAAAVAAALCAGHAGAQDAAAAHGLLPALAAFLAAEPPPPAATAAAWGLGQRPQGIAGDEEREAMLAVQAEVAGTFRSFCLRAAHHSAVRASGALPRLRQLAAGAGAGGAWAELRGAARRALQALGELPDPGRPLLTYGPHQLAQLLSEQVGGLGAGTAWHPACAPSLRAPQTQITTVHHHTREWTARASWSGASPAPSWCA